MNFKDFNAKIQLQFKNMCSSGKLFRAGISGRELWDSYLEAFVDEQIFRDPESSENLAVSFFAA